MKKLPRHQVDRIAAGYILAYKYLLGLFAVTVILAMATGDTQTFAATGGGFTAFNAYICRLRGLIGIIIGGLAVVTIIIAGVMYALSSGNDKGNISIGTAKTMIMSAVTGIVFYMLSDMLLGSCMGQGDAGLISNIFK